MRPPMILIKNPAGIVDNYEPFQTRISDTMNCSYHSRNPAITRCTSCDKGLCPACDHRIRGFPYCQDCIVSGVEMLRDYGQPSIDSYIKRRVSPFIATILSFIVPGLGAAYIGQTSKALVHFAIFASFFQMATMTGEPFFVLGVAGAWLFSAVDACRSAQLLRAGFNPGEQEDMIARRLYGNPIAWSLTLISIGVVFLLHTMVGIQVPLRRLLPVVLVLLGAYMLFDYIRRYRRRSEISSFDIARPPRSVVGSGPLGGARFRTGDIAADSRSSGSSVTRIDSR
jgi:hypothetical protein